MITIQHLNIQDHGEPGNRLGKTTNSGIGETTATQLAGQHPVVGSTELKTRKVLPVVGKKGANRMSDESTLRPAVVGNKGAGYMLEESRLRSTVGNNGVEYMPEGSMLRSAVGNDGAGYMLEEESTLRSAVGNNGAGYMLEEGSTLRPAVVGNKGAGYMLEEGSTLRSAVGNDGAGYMRERTSLGPTVGKGAGGIVWERTSLGPNVGNGAGGILTQALKPVGGDNGAPVVQKKKVSFGDPPTITLESKVSTTTIPPTSVGPEVSVGKTDKYHEEIWLSGSLKVLKGESPNASGKWLSKITEQAKHYRGMFTDLGYPIAYFGLPYCYIYGTEPRFTDTREGFGNTRTGEKDIYCSGGP